MRRLSVGHHRTRYDDTILEFLDDRKVAVPPPVPHYNLERLGYEIAGSTVKRRLALLEDVGLVEKEYEPGGYYAITEKGEAYLSGTLKATEPEPES